MKFQMQNQRYDRQQQPRNLESTSSQKTDFHFDCSAELQARHHQRQHQQRTRDRDGMSKSGARRMSSSSGSNSNNNINITTTTTTTTATDGSPRDTFQLRDDGYQLRSPPSSPRLLPSNSSVNKTRALAPRNGRVGPRLNLPISGQVLRSDWVSLEGLVSCALARLRKEECTGLSELGRGSHNSLYQLRFSDGTCCAASVSNSPPQFFSAEAKSSEIATMRYLHSSPRYNIPIPEIYAWDVTFDNPAGAPYILRECVQGSNLSTDGRFYQLSDANKIRVLKELAIVQAELSKPSEFTKLGCIYQREDNENEFFVGRIAALPSGNPEEDAKRKPFLGPYDSLPELWEARIDREVVGAVGNWSQLPSDELPSHLGPPSRANPQEFGELLQLLSGMMSLFNPPAQLSTLCIHHSDFALRNVLFDEETFKIAGVIDWEFASVMPLCITGRFPNDLGWEGNEFARSMGKLGDENEVWNHHYYDWTSLSGVAPPSRGDIPSPPASPAHPGWREEDYLTSPSASANVCGSRSPECGFLSNEEGVPSPPSPPLPPPPTSETSQQEIEGRAARLVQLFYYRKYYASRVALCEFSLTRLFMDSVAYIKFNEIVMGGASKWFTAADWIREVFCRLQSEDRSVRDELAAGNAVVRIPERFECTLRAEVDLGEPEKRLGYRR